MWIRQEYMPEKARYEKPFELEVSLPHDAPGQQFFENDAATSSRKSPVNSKRKITVKIAQNATAIGTTVWDGSIVLAKMFDNRDVFPLEYLKQSRVLELGAGCGLVGIYLCLLGAKTTVITDLACCVPNMQRNISLNVPKEQQSCISAMEYTWGKDASKLVSDGLYDVVVAAEVLYDEKDSVVLARSILKMIHSKSKVFVSMGRNRLGEASFISEMKNHGYQVDEVPNDQLHPKFQDSILKVIMVQKA